MLSSGLINTVMSWMRASHSSLATHANTGAGGRRGGEKITIYLNLFMQICERRKFNSEENKIM